MVCQRPLACECTRATRSRSCCTTLQMGEAMIRGFISSGISSPGRISCSVNTLERRQLLENLGVGNIFDDAEMGGAAGVAENSEVIVLGVKPQAIQPVLGERRAIEAR
jgi:pyrroline-5-carboxylate reductase